jgi:hypothetical protein
MEPQYSVVARARTGTTTTPADTTNFNSVLGYAYDDGAASASASASASDDPTPVPAPVSPSHSSASASHVHEPNKVAAGRSEASAVGEAACILEYIPLLPTATTSTFATKPCLPLLASDSSLQMLRPGSGKWRGVTMSVQFPAPPTADSAGGGGVITIAGIGKEKHVVACQASDGARFTGMLLIFRQDRVIDE